MEAIKWDEQGQGVKRLGMFEFGRSKGKNAQSRLQTSLIGTVLVLTFFGVLLTMAPRASAGTLVPPVISTDTVWDLAGSPYWVVSDVTVDPGVNLEIQLGVSVLFDGFWTLSVNGNIWVNGTALIPVTFNSNASIPAPGDWNGVQILPGAGANLSNSAFLYASSALTLQSSGSSIRNSTFFEFSGTGIGLSIGAMGNVVEDNVFTSVTTFGTAISVSPFLPGFGEYNLIARNTITGGGTGIQDFFGSNNTYQENSVLGALTCIGAFGTQNTTFLSNMLTGCSVGINGFFGRDNRFSTNTISLSTFAGFFLMGETHSLFLNNILTGNLLGFFLQSAAGFGFISQENELYSNTFSTSTFHLVVFGDTREGYNQIISTNNTVNGKPVYYYYNLGPTVLSLLDAGHITIAGSDSVTLQNSQTVGGDFTMVAFSNLTTIQDHNSSDASYGYWFVMAENSTLVRSETWNTGLGLFGIYSNHTTVEDSNFVNGTGYGLTTNGGWLRVANSSFQDNAVAVNLTSETFLSQLSCNRFNTSAAVHAQDWGTGNLWDNGAVGNYWDDYSGIDGNGDNIGDTPYVFSNNQDDYPLMVPECFALVPADPPSATALAVDNASSGPGILHILPDTPRLNWTYTDPNGDLQEAYHVQVRDAAAGGGTLLYDQNTTSTATETYPTPALPEGLDLYYRAKVKDVTQLWGSWAELAFRTNLPPPAPAEPVVPDSGALIPEGTVALEWRQDNLQSDGDALTNQWEISESSTFSTILDSGSEIDNESASINVECGKHYYWRANSTDSWETSAYGNGTWWSFSTEPCNSSPEARALGVEGESTPIALGHVLTQTPLFNWTFYDADPGAVQQNFTARVRDDGTSGTLWSCQETGTNQSILFGKTACPATSALQKGGNYTFRIQVYDELGAGSPWAELAFHLNLPPAVPTGIAPADEEKVRLENGQVPLSWSNVDDPESDPVSYEVEVKDAQTGAIVLAGTTTANGTDFEDGEQGKTYEWSVRATDGYEKSAWGEVSTFTIEDVEDPTVGSVLVSPKEVAAGDLVKINVSASDNVGVVSYRYRIKDASGKIVADSTTTNSTFQFSTAVPGTYTLVVEVRDAQGNSALSSETRFEVKAPSTVPGALLWILLAIAAVVVLLLLFFFLRRKKPAHTPPPIPSAQPSPMPPSPPSQ